MNHLLIVAILMLLLLILVIAIYLVVVYRREVAMIRFFVVIMAVLIPVISAQADQDVIIIPDDPYKPIVLPEIGKGIDVIASSLDPALGVPEHGIRITHSGRIHSPDEGLGLIGMVLGDYNFTDESLDIDTAWPEFANVTNLTFTIA
jgi:hypothetical protein